MTVKDWNKNFTAFIVDSINEIEFPYRGGENGMLNFYNFDSSDFCTRSNINSKHLLFQTVLYIDFDEDIEAEANLIERLEAYIREAFCFEDDVELLLYEAGESSYYGNGYKIVLKFKINKDIQDKLITLAKIKGYKI